MEYVQEITLDLNAKSAPPIVYAKQGDADTRVLEVHIMEDGNEYQPEPGTFALYRVLKPDGTYIGNDGGGEIAGLSNNIVYIRLSEQALAAAGRALVDVLLYNGNQYLSTMSFILNIQSAPTQVMRGVVSTNEYAIFSNLMSSLGEALGSVATYASRAETAASSAEAAASSFNLAAGTPMEPGKDPTITGTAPNYTVRLPSIKPMAKISIDESGSAASAAVSVEDYTDDPIEGYNSNLIKVFDFEITLPSGRNVQIDNSLTQEGQAADAKAVGDALASKYDAETELSPSNVGISSSSPLTLENGGTGATTASAARASLGVQALIQKATGTLASGSAWDSNNTQSLTITGMTSNSEFVASPNTSDGWAAAADAMLYPPVAGSNELVFTCETVPSVGIPITVYWW